MPVPVKGSTDEPSSKVNVLLQVLFFSCFALWLRLCLDFLGFFQEMEKLRLKAYISKLKLEGFALVSDMVYVSWQTYSRFSYFFHTGSKQNTENS